MAFGYVAPIIAANLEDWPFYTLRSLVSGRAAMSEIVTRPAARWVAGSAPRWDSDDRIMRAFEFNPNGARTKLFGGLLGWRERRDARATARDRVTRDPPFTDLVSDAVAVPRFVLGDTPEQPVAVGGFGLRLPGTGRGR